MRDEVVHGGFDVVIVVAVRVAAGRVVAGVGGAGVGGAGVGMGARVALVTAGRAPEMKGAMRDDAGAVFLVEAHRAPEMVRVRVGDEDGVDVTGREVRLFEPGFDRVPGALSR